MNSPTAPDLRRRSAVSILATVFVLASLIRLPVVPLVVLTIVWLAVVTLCLWATLPWCIRTHREAIRRRERQALQDGLNLLLSYSCACVDTLAVESAGWNGSVHTFYFANLVFAREFRRANTDKVLG